VYDDEENTLAKTTWGGGVGAASEEQARPRNGQSTTNTRTTGFMR